MTTAQQSFHPLPVIGYPESYYAKQVQTADQAGDAHAHAAYKVGQYVTLGLAHDKSWEEKQKYFRHALKHHCHGPQDADPQLDAYYRKLADLVRRHAGHEALRLARAENDAYGMRLEMGCTRDVIDEEAEVFFCALLGHCEGCPDWFTNEAYNQICAIRDHWI